MSPEKARLVDLTGIPDPGDPEQHKALGRQLAPFVGVAPFEPETDDPVKGLLESAIVRHRPDQRGLLSDQRHPETEAEQRHGAATAGPCPARFPKAGPGPDLVRGWYGTRDEPRWCPCQSLFGGRAGRHAGVDLAALPGTMVFSPLDGLAEYDPLGCDPRRGGHIFILDSEGPIRGIFLCHLERPVGPFPRPVQTGEAIALAGSSGLSIYEGRPNIFGKYDTHVHLEMVILSGRVDPLTALGLWPLHVEDQRCFFPADPQRLTVRVPHPLLERGTNPGHADRPKSSSPHQQIRVNR
ncbi:MAG: hypothetical protein EOM25_14835 [Deltaproteobacteria bacterium]|nr:hypothetical protein [Deltaproteobacteria bacterium]